MTYSLEESLDEPTLPGIPPVDVRAVLAATQHHFAPVSRETRLLSMAIIAHSLLRDDPGLGTDALADEVTRIVAVLERHA